MTRAVWLFLGMLLLVTALAYGPLFGQGFLRYDDDLYVTANAVVRRGLTLDGIRYAFTTTDLGNWHPLNWLSHMLDVQILGLRAGPMKGVNLAFHLLNSALLFVLLRRLTGAVWRSAFVGAVFALHPVHVASVAWIAERKDVLSTAFGLLTLLAWTAHLQGSRRGRVLALVFFTLGLLTKPMLVTLPIVMLLLDLWPLQRRESARQLLTEKAPFFGLAFLAGIAALVAQSSAGALQTIPAGVRIANAIVSIGNYLLATVWPANLAFFYPHPRSIDAPALLVSGAVASALTFLAWRWRRSAGWFATGWFWFLVMLVPVLGLIQIGGQARADRYLYLPMVGLTIVLAWGAYALALRLPRLRLAVVVLAGLALALCAWRTRLEVEGRHHARDAGDRGDTGQPHRALPARRRLCRARRSGKGARASRGGGANHAGSFRVQANLGKALLLTGRTQDAIPHSERAVELDPSPANRIDLAGAEMSRGNRDVAYQIYRAVLEESPDLPDAHFGVANVLLLTGKLDEAVRAYERTLELAPNHVDARVNLGLTLTHLGRFEEAIVQYQAALTLSPENVRAQKGLEPALRQRAATGAGS